MTDHKLTPQELGLLAQASKDLKAFVREHAAMRTALRIAREGYASEAVTGMPVTPQWRERTLALIDNALKD